jgi:hypothetical protein
MCWQISHFIDGSSRLQTLHFTKSHKIWYKSLWTVWILQQLFMEIHFLYWDRLRYYNWHWGTRQPMELKDVVRIVEPLFNLGYTLWLGNYYNLPSLFSLLRDRESLLREHCLNGKQSSKSKEASKGRLCYCWMQWDHEY